MEIGKSYKPFFLPGVLVVKHSPGQHWTLPSLGQHSNRGVLHYTTMHKIADSTSEKASKAEKEVTYRERMHIPSRGKVL